MICGYQDCQQEITDNQYTFKYFPEEQVHKPVHSWHLSANRKESEVNVPQKITPIKESEITDQENES